MSSSERKLLIAIANAVWDLLASNHTAYASRELSKAITAMREEEAKG